MSILDLLCSFFEKPTETITKIMKEKYMSTAFLGYFIGAIIVSIVFKIESPLGAGLESFVLSIIFFFVLMLSVGYFIASCSHLFLDMISDKSNATGLFTIIGLSHFLKAIILPYIILSIQFPILSDFTSLFVFFVIVAQIWLIVSMMQKTYQIKKRLTLFALLFSLIPAFISIVAIVILTLVGIFYFISMFL
ncbi:MAG: hypothetical protein HN833_02555 [Elusimicrobiaceae bacterium]|jgi:hypothetical protein|nr:hypothetical protein [Elusimicrobiaceae bacterium]MBT3955619.1 hypothetical protein [Elusimicrobiaceae bacterium]MBT4008733.1 hypothetical protein [Elusimicrobiaceae bacterium]MBT4402774.1 hypothetical protein [Elusimicrobiaceae bacterium]MBT4439591.1 hypothetical protein [Elusimicrobiaceae bacterium]